MKISHAGLIFAVSLLAACSSDPRNDRAPVNRAPSVSAIPATSMTANGVSPPIAFTLADENVQALVLSAFSDRPSVVPDNAIAVAGDGAARTLTITPVVDTTGDAMITVIANDTEGLAASSSFLLTVIAEQKSMSQFARDVFMRSADEEPTPINAVDFFQDADDDDFADLLAQ